MGGVVGSCSHLLVRLHQPEPHELAGHHTGKVNRAGIETCLSQDSGGGESGTLGVDLRSCRFRFRFSSCLRLRLGLVRGG